MSKKKQIKILRKIRSAVKGLFGSIIGVIMSIVKLPKTAWEFLKAVRRELKLVQWLSRRNTAKWSSAVILTALLLGGVIALLDLLLFKLRNLLFKL